MPDDEPRVVTVPDELEKALRAAGLRERLLALAPSLRKDILSYLNYVKKPETKERTIQKIINYLKRSK